MEVSVSGLVYMLLSAVCIGVVIGLMIRDVQRERAERRARWASVGGWPTIPMPFPPPPKAPPKPEDRI